MHWISYILLDNAFEIGYHAQQKSSFINQVSSCYSRKTFHVLKYYSVWFYNFFYAAFYSFLFIFRNPVENSLLAEFLVSYKFGKLLWKIEIFSSWRLNIFSISPKFPIKIANSCCLSSLYMKENTEYLFLIVDDTKWPF